MADNSVDIIIRAVDKASAVLTGVKGQFDKLNNSTLGKVTQQLTGFNLTTLGAAGAVAGVVKEVGKAVTEWSAYAEEVDKAAKLSGVGTEEMSRLIQAADDFRVEQDTLTNAMKMALKNGFVPTIDNLADLSDKYLAIQDPAERAAMMSKIFGRQFAEIEPLMRRGGDAIREGTAAVADNLVVTREAVKENDEYLKAVDDVGDAWTGVKNTVGKDVLPVVTDALQAVANGENLYQFIARIRKETKDTTPVLSDYSDEMHDVKDAYKELGDTGPDAEDAITGVKDATNDANEAMKPYTNTLLYNIASQGLDATAAMNLAIQMGLVDQKTVTATQKAADYKKMLDDGKITLEQYNVLVAGLGQYLDNLHDVEVHVQTYYDSYGNPPPSDQQSPGTGGPSQHSDNPIGGYANGTDFIIPAGWNENFPIGPNGGASSGERVTVTPNGSNQSNGLSRETMAAIQALTPDWYMVGRIIRDAMASTTR